METSGERRQSDVDLLSAIAGAIQNGLYGHGGIDPGTAACYSAAERVIADLGIEQVGWWRGPYQTFSRTHELNPHAPEWRGGECQAVYRFEGVPSGRNARAS